LKLWWGRWLEDGEAGLKKDELEGSVTDNSRTLAATIVGAALGALAGYLFFTERGRSFRRQLEPALDDFTRELNQFRGTVNKAAGALSEGWSLFNEAVGERPPQPKYPTPHQTSPF